MNKGTVVNDHVDRPWNETLLSTDPDWNPYLGPNFWPTPCLKPLRLVGERKPQIILWPRSKPGKSVAQVNACHWPESLNSQYSFTLWRSYLAERSQHARTRTQTVIVTRALSPCVSCPTHDQYPTLPFPELPYHQSLTTAAPTGILLWWRPASSYKYIVVELYLISDPSIGPRHRTVSVSSKLGVGGGHSSVEKG